MARRGGGRQRRGFGLSIAGLYPGRAALKLGGMISIATIIFAFWPELSQWLIIDSNTLANGRLPALITNSLVALPTSALGFVFLLAILGFFFLNQLQMLWYTDRSRLIILTVGLLATLAAINWLLRGFGWGLASALLMVLWFATAVERRWGEVRTLWFAFLVIFSVNAVGALLMMVWPGGRAGLAGGPPSLIHGTGPIVDALMTVWCLMAGSQRLAILNIKAKNLVWVLVIIQVFDTLLVGAINGLMGLTAILVTWLLITGNWRPRLAYDRFRLWLIERRVERRRRGFQVIDGNKTKH